MSAMGTCGDRDHNGRRFIYTAAALAADLPAGFASAPPTLLRGGRSISLPASPPLAVLGGAGVGGARLGLGWGGYYCFPIFTEH